MFRKLFLAFVALNALSLAALAIQYPSKNEHGFTKDSHGPRFEKYSKRHWELLSPVNWGLDPDPPREIGCGKVSSHSSGIRRFGLIGIVEEEGWQTTE